MNDLKRLNEVLACCDSACAAFEKTVIAEPRVFRLPMLFTPKTPVYFGKVECIGIILELRALIELFIKEVY